MSDKLSLLAALALSAITASAADRLTGIPLGCPEIQGHPASAMFDGDPATWYESKATTYTWGGIDLGSPHVITRIGLLPAKVSNGADLTLLAVVQGANNADFSDAIPIYMVKSTPAGGSVTYADVSCSRGFRYIRYCGPAHSRSRLSELELYGTPGEGDDSHLWQVTNLPTVVVNTVNAEEPYDKEHDIAGNIIIISENGTDILDKPGTIRERGNASREFPKKPWRIKFDKKQSVLGSPAKAKKWTLINNYGDKTLMRNILSFEVARMFGMTFVPFCRPVDVILNGEYKGCYQLCDQVEVNPGRVEVEEMEPGDISGDALTGGYLVEVDAYADQEKSWFTTAHYGLPVTIKSPDEDEIVTEQSTYIRDYFNRLENLMKDTDPVTGYRSVFDNRSFIQHMLVNEIAGNTDAYWSTYMYKRRNDPHIYTGPVWDFDLGWDNDARTYHVWQKSGDGWLWNSSNASAANGMLYFAQRILIKDPSTADEILDIWHEARTRGLSIQWLLDLVDSTAAELDQSQKLNFMRWPILKQFVHQNPQVAGSYAGELEVVRNYIRNQMPHLERVIGYEGHVSGISNPGLISGQVRIDGRRIVTEGYPEGTRYRVISLDGRCVAAALCGNDTHELAPGLYLVAVTDRPTVKVIIK